MIPSSKKGREEGREEGKEEKEEGEKGGRRRRKIEALKLHLHVSIS